MDKDKIKIVMCDVDGTLLTDKGAVSDKTVEAVRELRERGILFGLASGRDAISCQNLLPEWGLEGLVDCIVGMNGGEIKDLCGHVYKAGYLLDGELIWEIIRHFEDMEVNFSIPKQGILIGYRDDELIRMLAKADQLPYEIQDYHELLKEPQGKLMIVCEPDYMDQVIERSKTFSNPAYSCASLKTASVLYEYMDPGVSKSNGLKEVMELHGWTMESLLVFGDADNDEGMVRDAGIGVAMANGSENTKAAADYITADNNHDGIAEFLMKTGLVQNVK